MVNYQHDRKKQLTTDNEEFAQTQPDDYEIHFNTCCNHFVY